MQDRYFGDIGDFAKFGLLRAVFRGQPELRLGVLWCRVPDEITTNDGRHIGYLKPTPQNEKRFRECDPGLYETLKRLVGSGQRAISLAAEHQLLPPGTDCYDAALSYRNVPMADRPGLRQRWLSAAVSAMAAADIVFVDPDNGLEVSTGRYGADGPKYTFYGDLVPFAESGRGLIIYQHACRDGSFEDQIAERLGALREQLRPHLKEFMALRFSRFSARAFLFALGSRHAEALRPRIHAFLNGPWSQHFNEVGQNPFARPAGSWLARAHLRKRDTNNAMARRPAPSDAASQAVLKQRRPHAVMESDKR